MGSESSVRRYYDRNTRRFLRFGGSGPAAVIHRTLRGPGIADPFRYQESCLLELLREHQVRTVVDLGCGVGSSLDWLRRRHPGRYIGITLSETQADLARRYTGGSGIDIHAGSYLNPDFYEGLPREEGKIMFYGIESWLHCADPAGLLALVSGRTAAGDLFALWDDFPEELNGGPVAKGVLADFREGWQVLNDWAPIRIDDAAAACGLRLIVDRNMTPLVDTGRFRDRLVSAAFSVLRPLGLKNAWWRNLQGGNALRRSLEEGWLAYRFRVWIRT